jgi:hypothetical protein
VADDLHGEPYEPKAGHRSLTALTLVLGSVIPVTFGAVVIWTLAGWPVDTYGALLLVAAAMMATAMPYAVGWLRSLVCLLATTTLLRALEVWLADEPRWLLVVASVALVAVMGALTRWSLRFGKIRRPNDAKSWRAASSDTWPYPYV